jgi:hypothetical protein
VQGVVDVSLPLLDLREVLLFAETHMSADSSPSSLHLNSANSTSAPCESRLCVDSTYILEDCALLDNLLGEELDALVMSRRPCSGPTEELLAFGDDSQGHASPAYMPSEV